MADNVTYTAAADATPPGGTKAATDELSDGSHAGIAKIAVSADGDRTLIPATAADGLLVEVSNPTAGTGLTNAELRATPVDVDASGSTVPVSNAGLTALNGAIAGTEVQVDLVGSVPAGNNNIGDVDIASLPNEGQQTMANSISVAVASDQTAIPVSGSVSTGGLTDAELRATPVPVSGTVTANAGTNLNTSALALEAGGNLAAIASSASVLDDWDETNRAAVNTIAGQVGVAGGSGVDSALTQRVSLATNVALPAGNNNIGDVDVASSVLPTGAATLAEQQTQTASLSVMDDWDESDRAKVNPIVGQAGVAAGTGTDGVTVQRVTLATNVALPAGNNNIGDVDIASFPATALEVVGDVAADVAVPANPLAVGGRASDALPTEVSNDGDSVYQWLLRNGAAMTAQLPHLGLIGDPYTLDSETAQYTTAQTSTILVAVGTGPQLALTSIQIQAGGTVAGTVQVYFGDGSYNRGNSLAVFDGEFAPSATLKPGFAMAFPKPLIGPVNQDLRVTGVGAINPLTITVWFYLIS